MVKWPIPKKLSIAIFNDVADESGVFVDVAVEPVSPADLFIVHCVEGGQPRYSRRARHVRHKRDVVVGTQQLIGLHGSQQGRI